jgi:diketogulonate reductase-like aldo/keto reductase
MTETTPLYTLNNGVSMPAFGLGVYQLAAMIGTGAAGATVRIAPRRADTPHAEEGRT